jgi:beta-glucosidase
MVKAGKKRFLRFPNTLNYFLLLALSITLLPHFSFGATNPYQDDSLSYRDRARDLVARMTVLEKANQVNNFTSAISRLGLPQYIYQAEGIHGWFGFYNTRYTIFPVPMAMGATWDPALVNQVGSAISDEARGNHNAGLEDLNVFAPTINLARDPRWGRTEETYTEDPYLLSRFAVNYVLGMEGTNAKYLKTGTTLKHFACNNYEAVRNYGSSNPDERSLREYFLPAFQAGIFEGRSRSVMNAYNALNGIPCNVNGYLLQDILRGEWGFDGFVISDCGDITDTVTNHHYSSTIEDACALSIKNGCDNDCGSNEFRDNLPQAVRDKKITEADIDIAARRTLETRFRFGELDTNKTLCPFNSIPQSVINSAANQTLARQVEREAIVLLKNNSNLLPLSKTLSSLAVIGPYANDYYLGGYTNSNPFYKVSPVQGIRNKLPNLTVNYSQGANMDGTSTDTLINNAANVAGASSMAVVIVGTNDNFACEGKDAANLDLPGRQTELVQRVLAANPQTVVVLCSGNPLSINWIAANVPAILESWHGGQEYGNALADVLFGDYNPGGKVPQTYYKDSTLLPALSDYNIFNKRLYMYCDDTNVLYPFGYGLSYTTFTYSNLNLSSTTINSYDTITINVDVRNSGSVTGDEVVQLYLKAVAPSITMPKKALKGFQRVTLTPGQIKTVSFTLKGTDVAYYNTTQKLFVVDPGNYQVMVGSSSADIRQTASLSCSWVAPRFAGIFKIVNKNSGLALKASDDTQDYNGQSILQGNYYGYNTQRWMITQVDANNFQIINRQSNYGFDIQNSSTTPGALLQEWNYAGADNQRFSLTDLGNGYYSIKAKHSTLAIEVQGSSTADGASVAQNTYTGSANQQWQIVSVNDNTAVDLPPAWNSETKVFIANGSNYLSAKNNNLAVKANQTSGGANELIYLYDLGAGAVVMKSELNGKYLRVNSSDNAVYADQNTTGTSATFTKVDLGGGNFAFRSQLNNNYLSIGNTGNALMANKTSAGSTETFVITTSTLDPGIVPWTATASLNSASANLAFDREPSTRWTSGAPQANGMWYKLDLSLVQTVSGITLDSTASPDDYPRGYTVQVSTDDSTYTQVASAAPGTVVHPGGVVTITFNAVSARYLKITQTGSDPGLFWSIHELYVNATGGATPTPTPTATPTPAKYEAENGVLGNGATVTNDSAASGGKCVQNLHIANSYCQIGNVMGGNGGTGTLHIYYATNDSGAQLDVSVNGTSLGLKSMPSTGGWSNFSGHVQLTVTLISGLNNTIKFTGGHGGVNLDYITIVTGPPIGKNISLKCAANNYYICSENGTSSMNCNRSSAGAWETFLVADAGNGKIALMGCYNNVAASRYVSSENGAAAMNCNRTSTGPWETFTWIENGDGTISLQGSTGSYVTGSAPMWCNVATIGSSQKFQVTTY